MYNNINFINKLPEEALIEDDFAKLVKIKDSIDLKLKQLENKIKGETLSFEKPKQAYIKFSDFSQVL